MTVCWISCTGASAEQRAEQQRPGLVQGAPGVQLQAPRPGVGDRPAGVLPGLGTAVGEPLHQRRLEPGALAEPGHLGGHPEAVLLGEFEVALERGDGGALGAHGLQHTAA
ncbi:hypothetical protein [Streptomyces sp. NPDC059513]|uniref:hypothetical protein n=1 Tax=unclassified Streptomyces TaxID=2593676 RepID=UPI0036AF868A